VEAEAAVKAERDAELRAVEAERVAVAEVKRVVEGEAAEREEAKRATHLTDERLPHSSSLAAALGCLGMFWGADHVATTSHAGMAVPSPETDHWPVG
jgi:hypothetical protein